MLRRVPGCKDLLPASPDQQPGLPAYPVPQGRPDLILLDQNQHDALHGALAAEARIGLPIDQVFLVQNDGGSADPQHLSRRADPQIGGHVQPPALPGEGNHRSGEIGLIVPLEGQHQVLQAHAAGGALDPVQLPQHVVKLHGGDGGLFHVGRPQHGPAALRGVHRGAQAFRLHQLLIHPGAPGRRPLAPVPLLHHPGLLPVLRQVPSHDHGQDQQNNPRIGAEQLLEDAAAQEPAPGLFVLILCTSAHPIPALRWLCPHSRGSADHRTAGSEGSQCPL